jgi:arabinan endo-1,5-alpha-L-arabinosidase
MRSIVIHLFCIIGLACLTTVSRANEVVVHDPAMAQEGKTFYLFSTGPGIPFYSSTDLKNWQKEGEVFSKEPKMTRQAAPEYAGFPWAPDVYFHKGKYYVYFAVSTFGKNMSGIGVATNKTLNPKSPDYQWEELGAVITSVPNRDDWNAIDAAVIDDEKGTAWMSFGSFWSGIKLVKLNEDRTKPAEPQEWYSLAQRERKGITNSNEPPKDGAVEAPFIYKKNGYYYLFVSFDLCCRGEKSTYNIRVGRSKILTGPYLDKEGKDMNQGGGSLVLGGDKDFIALGHNSAYTFNKKDYLVFHAYDTKDKYVPKLKIIEMKWDADLWPKVAPKDVAKYKSTLK